jgi:uncharacterized protein with HEPN domain
MHADSLKLLWDAQDAAERVKRFVAGKSFEIYLGDELLRSAVERQLEIVGEAMSQLRRIDPDTYSTIPDAPRVVGFRNVLAHGYASVDNRIVWGIVIDSLDRLIESLNSLLKGQ